MLKGIWIAWESHRRSHGISDGLGVKLYTIVSNKPRIFRYLESVLKTVKILLLEKPEVVFAQNPSIVLALLVIVLKPFFFKKVVIDSHNSGIYPFNNKYRLLNYASLHIQKHANLTIVTNRWLKKVVESNNGRASVLFDRLPAMAKVNNAQNLKGWNFVLISSYAKDEPFGEVFKSAKFLPGDFKIFVTGNYRGKVNPKDVPHNVKLTGYLSEAEYWTLINRCQIVMDLTCQDNCLVCGAYEGIAAGKPLIISDTVASRELFRIGCIYVKSTAVSIAKGILKAVSEYNTNVIEISRLKIEMEHKWKSHLNIVREKVLY